MTLILKLMPIFSGFPDRWILALEFCPFPWTSLLLRSLDSLRSYGTEELVPLLDLKR